MKTLLLAILSLCFSLSIVAFPQDVPNQAPRKTQAAAGAHQVCPDFCVNGQVLFLGMGCWGRGRSPSPAPISVEVGCAFIAEFFPGPASVPATES